MTVDYKDALTLASQKKKLFQEYETITDTLLNTEDYDDMENYITYRTKLANNIDKISEELEIILAPLGTHEEYILGKAAEDSSLKAEEKSIFDLSQETREIVRRIRLKDRDLMQEYEHRQKENIQHIKASQNTPKISRYLQNLSVPQDDLNNLGSV